MRPSTIVYPPEGVKPIGIIEFVHGMCETRNRYAKPMEILSQKGFICAIADMRGHGENILTNDDLGYFGDDGYKGLVDDVHEYTMFLKREYPGLPLVIIGHSMGSLITRAYMKRHSKEVEGIILSGSPSDNPLTGVAKLLIRIMAPFRGWHYRSPFIQSCVTGTYERPFKREGVLNAWLTRDKNIVDTFNKDPLCGFPFTLNGYMTLMDLMQQVYSPLGWISKNPKLPVMFISGEEDPCRGSNKAFQKAVSHLKKCGYPNTMSQLYVDMRHELLNEIDNEQVYKDIIKFIEVKVGIDTE